MYQKSGTADEANEIDSVVDLLGGREVLRRTPHSALEVHDLIQDGIPGQALNHLVELLIVPHHPDFLLEKAFGLSLRTYQRLKNAPERTLAPDQGSRAWQFAKILARATRVLGSQAAAETWLDTPAIALEQRKPLDLLATHEGAGLVEALLTRLEYGVYT
ncbi:MAG TPA: antitoxin Xre/MbcA/ParS toxin-binding domain-containing protein [Azospirillaceae bacterium]|nr:antitoxin Xre/MbcA/ParS toxin-binding domain-containing protein [Azospirillaceae bacterium]